MRHRRDSDYHYAVIGMGEMPEKDMFDLCEEKARKGDGNFAIAFALLTLADAQTATANALRKLGLAEASTPFGAIEALGMQIEKAGQLVADAVGLVAVMDRPGR